MITSVMTAPTITLTGASATYSSCLNYTSCSDCILNLCIYIILNSGELKCVHEDILYLYARAHDVIDLVGPGDPCPEETFRQSPVKIHEYLRDQKLASSNHSLKLAPTLVSWLKLTTNVSVGLNITSIGLDEVSSVFSVGAKLNMEWLDHRLGWMPNDTISESMSVQYTQAEIWIPEVFVCPYTNFAGSEIKSVAVKTLNVSRTGRVTWRQIPAQLRSTCQLDMFGWPFDSHTCNVSLTIRSSAEGKVTDLWLFSERTNNTEDDIFVNKTGLGNSQWQLVQWGGERKEIDHPCCPQHFVHIVFSFTLSRNIGYFTYLVIAALCLIVPVNIWLFLGPLLNLTKLVFTVISLLLIMVLMSQIEHVLQSNTDGKPIIAVLYYLNLVPIGLTFLTYLLLARFRSTTRLPPEIFMRFCHRVSVQQILFCGLPIPVENISAQHPGVRLQPMAARNQDEGSGDEGAGEDRGGQEEERDDDEISYVRKLAKREWHLFVYTLFRILLAIYSVVTAIVLLGLAS